MNRSPHLGLTVNAIRHLIARTLLLRRPARWFLFAWAEWRIMHNEEARTAHYRSPKHMQL